jgi:hypothetical protein
VEWSAERIESVPMKTKTRDRTFQLWQYRVSHGELLVRSPKDSSHARNADIMFVGVEYLELPRFLPRLHLDEPNDEDIVRAQARLGKSLEHNHVFVLCSQDRRFIVVAAAMKCGESDMDIFNTPFA